MSLLRDLISRARELWSGGGGPPPESPREYLRNAKVWTKVSSSNVGAIAYYIDIRRKGEGNRLAVWFHTSRMVYTYPAPYSVYSNMIAASSKGRFVWQTLRGIGHDDKWPAESVM